MSRADTIRALAENAREMAEAVLYDLKAETVPGRMGQRSRMAHLLHRQAALLDSLAGGEDGFRAIAESCVDPAFDTLKGELRALRERMDRLYRQERSNSVDEIGRLRSRVEALEATAPPLRQAVEGADGKLYVLEPVPAPAAARITSSAPTEANVRLTGEDEAEERWAVSMIERAEQEQGDPIQYAEVRAERAPAAALCPECGHRVDEHQKTLFKTSDHGTTWYHAWACRLGDCRCTLTRPEVEARLAADAARGEAVDVRRYEGESQGAAAWRARAEKAEAELDAKVLYVGTVEHEVGVQKYRAEQAEARVKALETLEEAGTARADRNADECDRLEADLTAARARAEKAEAERDAARAERDAAQGALPPGFTVDAEHNLIECIEALGKNRVELLQALAGTSGLRAECEALRADRDEILAEWTADVRDGKAEVDRVMQEKGYDSDEFADVRAGWHAGSLRAFRRGLHLSSAPPSEPVSRAEPCRHTTLAVEDEHDTGKMRDCERERGHAGPHRTTYCGKPYEWAAEPVGEAATDDAKLYAEWKGSADVFSGECYRVNRYGEGALGNPVVSYDRATVEALIRGASAARASALEACVKALEMYEEEDADESRQMGKGGPAAPWYTFHSRPLRKAVSSALALARAAETEGGESDGEA